jgi:hypothetical protein
LRACSSGVSICTFVPVCTSRQVFCASKVSKASEHQSRLNECLEQQVEGGQCQLHRIRFVLGVPARAHQIPCRGAASRYLVIVRQRTRQRENLKRQVSSTCCLTASEYVSMRQHTSAYVSIRQHTSAYVSTCCLTAELRDKLLDQVKRDLHMPHAASQVTAYFYF